MTTDISIRISTFQGDNGELVLKHLVSSKDTKENLPYVHLLLDMSGSMQDPQNFLLLKKVMACLAFRAGMKSSEGEFSLGTPGGTSPILKAAIRTKEEHSKADMIVVVTDGQENEYEGYLPDSEGKKVAVSFKGTPGMQEGNPSILADALQRIGVTVCVLGLGPEGGVTSRAMLGRPGVLSAHVDIGDNASVIFNMLQILINPAGVPDILDSTGAQIAVIHALHPVVQSMPDISPDALISVAGWEEAIPDLSSNALQESQVRDAFLGEFKQLTSGINVSTMERKMVFALVLFLMNKMIDAKGPVPAMVATGRRSSLIAPPTYIVRWAQIKRWVNMLLTRLCKHGVLERQASVPEGGSTLTIQQHRVKAPAKSAQYSTQCPSRIVKALSQDIEFAVPQTSLTLKRKRKKVSSSARKKKHSKNTR